MYRLLRIVCLTNYQRSLDSIKKKEIGGGELYSVGIYFDLMSNNIGVPYNANRELVFYINLSLHYNLTIRND